MNLPKDERCPSTLIFCCGREQFRVHPEFAPPVREGKSNSCLSLLVRSVPTCGPEVDDAHGLYLVRGIDCKHGHDSETGCTGMRLA
jgi:hypothetical protein